MKNSFFTDVSIISGSQIISGGASFAYTMIAARILGLHDFGLFQSLMALYSAFSFFSLPLYLASVHGIGTAPKQEVKSVVGEFVWIALIGSLGTMLVLILAAPKMSSLLRTSIVSIYCVAVTLLTRAILTTLYGALQGQNEHSSFSLARSLESIICLGAGVILLKSNFGVTGAILAYFVAMLALIIYFSVFRKMFVFPKKFSHVKKELNAITYILISFGVFLAIDNIPIVLGRSFLTESDNGLLGVLFNLKNILLPFAFAVAVPFYTNLLNEASDPKLFYRALGLVSFFGIGFIASGALFPRFVIGIIYGNEYTAAASYMPLYGISLWLEMIVMILIFHQVKKKQLHSFYLLVPVVLLLVGMNYINHTINDLVLMQIGIWVVYLVMLLRTNFEIKKSI